MNNSQHMAWTMKKVRRIKVRKVVVQDVEEPKLEKQKRAVCLCGSSDLRALFLQVYGCNTDILTRTFDRRYKWSCRNCGSEFFAHHDEEKHWTDLFTPGVSTRHEQTWPVDIKEQVWVGCD